MARSYWSIEYFDTGASAGLGGWVQDTKIPRAGLENASRLNTATIEFLELADGSEAKLSSETKSRWGEIILTFPKQRVDETVKTQLKDYIDNEIGIRLHVPIITGASAYTEQLIEGYPTIYEETWELDNRSNIRNIVRLTIKEFNVDGS